MKSIKNKLIASVAMLVVATVMMTSASFAWFTVSTAPDVQNVQVSLQATKNLEIALAGQESTGNSITTPAEVTQDDNAQTAWGSLVSFESNLEAAEVTIPAVLDTDGSIKTVKYGTDGRTDGLEALTAGTLGSTGIGYYTKGTDTNAPKGAVIYGMWLRTNTEGDLKATVSGAGTGVKYAFEVYAAPANTVANESATLTKVGTGLSQPSSGDTTTLLDGTTNKMAANTYYLVKIVLYVDGSSIYAQDVANTISGSITNIEFTNTQVGTGDYTAPSGN